MRTSFPFAIATVLLQLLAAPCFAETLTSADQTAAFKAAKFTLKGKVWHSDCGDPSDSYTGGTISEVRDVNGDKNPEAVITEGSTFCHGMTGAGYSIVSKQADGSWKLIASGTGMTRFLSTKGTDGWPDLEVGGPGFCFPVERWNGKAYVLQRHEYEGKACKPNL